MNSSLTFSLLFSWATKYPLGHNRRESPHPVSLYSANSTTVILKRRLEIPSMVSCMRTADGKDFG